MHSLGAAGISGEDRKINSLGFYILGMIFFLYLTELGVHMLSRPVQSKEPDPE